MNRTNLFSRSTLKRKCDTPLERKQDTKMSIQKNYNIDKKPSKQQVTLQQVLSKPNQNQIDKIMYGTISQRYHFLAQNPFVVAKPVVTNSYNQKQYGEQLNDVDATLLWSGAVSVSPIIRKKVLVFRQLQYIIPNWSGYGYPNVIYICAPGLLGQGFMDKTGFRTDKVAALQLNQVSPVLDDAQVRTYDLRYVLKQSVTWQLATDTALINFKVKIDDELDYTNLPLPNPISLNFEIRLER